MRKKSNPCGNVFALAVYLHAKLEFEAWVQACRLTRGLFGVQHTSIETPNVGNSQQYIQ